MKITDRVMAGNHRLDRAQFCIVRMFLEIFFKWIWSFIFGWLGYWSGVLRVMVWSCFGGATQQGRTPIAFQENKWCLFPEGKKKIRLCYIEPEMIIILVITSKFLWIALHPYDYTNLFSLIIISFSVSFLSIQNRLVCC